MKFLLIEHGEGNTPATVTVCNSFVERLAATRAAILGPDNEGELCPELLTLQEDGRVMFAGDPPMEWLDASALVVRNGAGG